MEIKCPHCDASIPAENINIQELVALCSECDHVFEFDRRAVARKANLRKLKVPERVCMRVDNDRMELSYRLVFGSGPKFGMIMASFATVVTMILLANAYASHEPVSLQIFLGLLTLLGSYLVAVFVTTTTTIRADEEGLEVTSGPLPFPITDDKFIGAGDITRVFFEKSLESPFPLSYYAFADHNVCAEMRDGEQIPIVTSLPRLHARYIARTLDDYLHEGPADDLGDTGEEGIDDAVPLDSLAENVAEYRQGGSN